MLYVKLTMPDFNGLALRSFKECRSFTSLNSAFPSPKIMGLTIKRTSSSKPLFIKENTKVAPPHATIFLPCCSFNIRISSMSLNDTCRLPGDLVKSLGKDEMGYLIGTLCISGLISCPLCWVGQEGKPVLFVSGIHTSPKD